MRLVLYLGATVNLWRCEMKLEKVLDEIIKSEGFRNSVYKDSEGYWTIGHGILVDPRRGGGITKDESLYIVRRRLNILQVSINQGLPWTRKLSDGRREALLRMAYNLGFKGLKTFKKMLSALEEGKYEVAADEALDSKWAKQVGDRAIRIADLIRNG